MHSYEMIATADQNGRTYISKYGTYSKADGFDLRLNTIRNYYDAEQLLNKLLHEDCWRLKVDKKKMTRAEIEKELGYEIEIVGEHSKDNEHLNDLYKQLNTALNEYDIRFFR